MILLFRALSVLPLWLLHAVGWLLGWVAFVFSGVYRRRFLTNAGLAGVPASQWRGAVGAAGQMVAEVPRLWFGRAVPVLWQGEQHIEAALANGQGIVFLTPHLGCFEITAQAYAQRFGAQQAVTVLYRPARKAAARELIDSARARAHLHTAPTTMAGVKQLLKALRKGQCVGLLPDQVPPQGLGVWAPFFGADAYTMTLSARLAQQTGAAVLLAWGQRLPWGRGYTVQIQPLSAPLPSHAQPAAATINRAMEQLVAQCPQQYLWGYARYKSPREGA